MLTAAWIIYGALITLRMANLNAPIQTFETWFWIGAALLLEVWAIIADWRQKSSFKNLCKELTETKDSLAKAHEYNKGQIGVLSLLSSKALEVLTGPPINRSLAANELGNFIERFWRPLNSQEKGFARYSITGDRSSYCLNNQ